MAMMHATEQARRVRSDGPAGQRPIVQSAGRGPATGRCSVAVDKVTGVLFRLRYPFLALAIVTSLFTVTTPAYSTGLFDFEGRPRNLSEFTGHGRWTVVMFWASDCRVCNAEAQEYVLFHDQHHDRQAGVLGITLDGEAGKSEALGFIERHMVDFPNLIGEPEVVARLYTDLVGEP